jgi:CDP-2,3-bis-(O-geranylgeranyl)-sn-glycerol synthase
VTHVDPLAAAAFILLAFTLAGVAQTAWFAAPVSHTVALPLDGGFRFHGRRIFGDNKTLRGFVVMVPAAAAAFALLAMLAGAGGRQLLWPLSLPAYALLGAWAGFAFMAGELPNSFLKRQRGIAPGEAPRGATAAVLHFLLDRLDSGIGMLAALSLVVDVPLLTWACVLLVGPSIHWSFSVLMFRLGLKGRAA